MRSGRGCWPNRASEMAEEFDIPAPHETSRLIGHADAIAQLASSLRGGRTHHAWLLTGPRGIGKATLAYRAAAYLLAGLPETDAPLGVPEKHPVAGQVAQGASPGLFVYQRRPHPNTGRMRTEIDVDQVREIEQRVRLRAGDGWRVGIVDCVDELNKSSANALLKLIEEPPDQMVFFLVAHSPGRVLPTIRSRCTVLRLNALSETDTRAVVEPLLADVSGKDLELLVRLADGSPGRAVELAAAGGAALYRSVTKLLDAVATPDTTAIHKLGDSLAADRSGTAFLVAGDIISRWVRQQTRAQLDAGSAGGQLDRWARLWEKVTADIARAHGQYLDRKQAFIDIFHTLHTAAVGPDRVPA